MALPKDILLKRIRNELKLLVDRTKHDIGIEGDLDKFPIRVWVTLNGVPGPILKDGEVHSRYEHRFLMELTEEYPYRKPIVIWATEIFHPNIMLPEDGGFVCIKLLEDWGFGSNLLHFIQGLEALVSNPNPRDPYGTDSCTRAAQLFNKRPYSPPGVVKGEKRPRPKIIDSLKAKIGKGSKDKPRIVGTRKAPDPKVDSQEADDETYGGKEDEEEGGEGEMDGIDPDDKGDGGMAG
jgi:ubiquitin-protein ligase